MPFDAGSVARDAAVTNAGDWYVPKKLQSFACYSSKWEGIVSRVAEQGITRPLIWDRAAGLGTGETTTSGTRKTTSTMSEAEGGGS
jgi:hypothetical protein